MNLRKPGILLVLIIACEGIYFLPFVLARIFRPTMLEVFQITNSELGNWFAIYGVVAMVSYVLGGPLADRFPARKLMALSLILTSLGGFFMATVPDVKMMSWLYVLWGFTTVFLFWAALIRATREWGGDGFQGRAFGWLEGGRGAVAAIMGTVAFLIFREAGPGSTVSADETGGMDPFQIVILVISAMTSFIGVLVWFVVPEVTPKIDRLPLRTNLKRIRTLVKKPTIWMLGGLILCSYSGYKITDDYSLYAREVLGATEVGAVGFGTTALWLRAIVAILAGWLGDRLDRTRVIIGCFTLIAVGGILTGTGIMEGTVGLMILSLFLTAAGIYGVRALYFAIMEEADIPVGYTGTAVGIVSFIGFMPEIFISPWMGYLLDTNPGVEGHRFVFLLLSMFACMGMGIGWLLKREVSKDN